MALITGRLAPARIRRLNIDRRLPVHPWCWRRWSVISGVGRTGPDQHLAPGSLLSALFVTLYGVRARRSIRRQLRRVQLALRRLQHAGAA